MNKKEIIQFLEKEETYNQVLEIIENECHNNGTHLGAYPQDYFIAGGAVANTIHYLLNKENFNRPVINDVDLFFFNHIPDIIWYEYNADMILQENINNTVNTNGYGNSWVGSHGEEIRMVNSERFDIINKITINVHLWRKNFVVTDYYKQLLNNFDLNCTMVGLDRVNNKFVFDDEFVYFLETNKIEVRGINNPIQTAVRMYKKGIELKTNTVSFETEMSLLQHSFIMYGGRSIGPEWMLKVDNYGEFLRDYFMEDPKTKHGNTENLYHYTSKPFELKEYVNQFNFTNNKTLIFFWDVFVRVKCKETLGKLLTFYFNFKGLRKESETKTWSCDSVLLRTNKPINRGGYDLMDIAPRVSNYFDCSYSVQDLIQIDEFFSYLGSFNLDPYLYITSNVKEQKEFIKFFNKYFIKNGLIRTDFLMKVLRQSSLDDKKRTDIVSTNKEVKIKTFKVLLDNIWINKKSSSQLKHRFTKNNLNYLDLIRFLD